MLTLKDKIRRLKEQYSESRDASRSRSGSVAGRNEQQQPRSLKEHLSVRAEEPSTSNVAAKSKPTSHQQRKPLINFLNKLGSQNGDKSSANSKTPRVTRPESCRENQRIKQNTQHSGASLLQPGFDSKISNPKSAKQEQQLSKIKSEVKRKYFERFSKLNQGIITDRRAMNSARAGHSSSIREDLMLSERPLSTSRIDKSELDAEGDPSNALQHLYKKCKLEFSTLEADTSHNDKSIRTRPARKPAVDEYLIKEKSPRSVLPKKDSKPAIEDLNSINLTKRLETATTRSHSTGIPQTKTESTQVNPFDLTSFPDPRQAAAPTPAPQRPSPLLPYTSSDLSTIMAEFAEYMQLKLSERMRKEGCCPGGVRVGDGLGKGLNEVGGGAGVERVKENEGREGVGVVKEGVVNTITSAATTTTAAVVTTMTNEVVTGNNKAKGEIGINRNVGSGHKNKSPIHNSRSITPTAARTNILQQSDRNLQSDRPDVLVQTMKEATPILTRTLKPAVISDRRNGPVHSYAANAYGNDTDSSAIDRITVYFNLFEYGGKQHAFSFFGLYRSSVSCPYFEDGIGSTRTSSTKAASAANRFKHNLHQWILSSPDFPSNIPKAFRQAIVRGERESMLAGENPLSAFSVLLIVGKASRLPRQQEGVQCELWRVLQSVRLVVLWSEGSDSWLAGEGSRKQAVSRTEGASLCYDEWG